MPSPRATHTAGLELTQHGACCAFAYSLFGCTVASDVPIPGLVPLDIEVVPDVVVRLGSMPRGIRNLAAEPWFMSTTLGEDQQPLLVISQLDGGAYFRMVYFHGMEFIIDRRGRSLWAVCPETSTLEDVATYLLGPVFGFLLLLRGVTCLHASAVAFGDRAVAFIGTAGAGKSTIAAAFAGMGYPVLTDDVLPLWEEGSAFMAQPAYPRVRLWRESVTALYGSPEALPRLTPSWDKRYLDLEDDDRFQREALPLGAIYLLGRRANDPNAPFVKPAPANERMLALIANSYGGALANNETRAREFKLFGRMTRTIPIRRAVSHADPRLLDRFCEVLLEDWQALHLPAHKSA